MRTAARAMSTVRRLGKDESGMTLGLAMVMVLLIGVMGAGLLTFVSKDLSTVLEVNRGQRAFEVADAGVGVAKRQLTLDCSTNTTCIDHYDDLNGSDYQWTPARGGVTLNNLDGSPATADNVHVAIDYRYETDDFKVVSTGNYGVAKRKIEAIFKGISGGPGGSGIGLPTYYTPSAIRIEDPLQLTGLSLFTETDILFNNLAGHANPTAFKNDVEDNNSGYLQTNNADELSFWDSTQYPIVANRGFWNTQPRYGGPFGSYTTCKNKNNGDLNTCNQPGLAALGKICDAPVTAASCGSNPSIADGVYGYDSTTGTDLAPLDAVTGYPTRCPTAADPDNSKTSASTYLGNKLTFCEKPQALIDAKQPNASGTISFPFPRPTPNAARLRGYAQEVPGNHYFPNVPSPTELNNIYPSSDQQVVFIDAQGGTVNFNPSSNANNKGLLVVWCGDLQMNKKFQGIILNLYPDGAVGNQLPGGSNCGPDKGIFTNNGQDISGWIYAIGGNNTDTPGIVFRRSSAGVNPQMNTLPAGNWSFFNDAFSGGPPTSVQLQGWRELYQ